MLCWVACKVFSPLPFRQLCEGSPCRLALLANLVRAKPGQKGACVEPCPSPRGGLLNTHRLLQVGLEPGKQHAMTRAGLTQGRLSVAMCLPVCSYLCRFGQRQVGNHALIRAHRGSARVAKQLPPHGKMVDQKAHIQAPGSRSGLLLATRGKSTPHTHHLLNCCLPASWRWQAVQTPQNLQRLLHDKGQKVTMIHSACQKNPQVALHLPHDCREMLGSQIVRVYGDIGLHNQAWCSALAWLLQDCQLHVAGLPGRPNSHMQALNLAVLVGLWQLLRGWTRYLMTSCCPSCRSAECCRAKWANQRSSWRI